MKTTYEAIKRYRAAKAAHPELYHCDCGQSGFKLKNGSIVCARCDSFENQYQKLANLRLTHQPWAAGMDDWFFDIPNSRNCAQDMILDAEEEPDTWIDDTPEVPICDDCGGSVMAHLDMCPITVHGHGTYVLPLEAV